MLTVQPVLALKLAASTESVQPIRSDVRKAGLKDT